MSTHTLREQLSSFFFYKLLIPKIKTKLFLISLAAWWDPLLLILLLLPSRSPACWPGAPPGATAVSYLWSPQEQGPASPETFSYTMLDAASPPLLVHLWRMLSALGGPPLPALPLAPGEALAR